MHKHRDTILKISIWNFMTTASSFFFYSKTAA